VSTGQVFKLNEHSHAEINDATIATIKANNTATVNPRKAAAE
jgi:hypothetical protein